MGTLTKIKTFLGLCLSWIFYGISMLVPRDKHRWIFIGWYKNAERETFADNAKYVFLEVCNNHPGIQAVWIGGDDKICNILSSHGYPSYPVNSWKGIWYSLRAGYTIIDANMRVQNWRLSGRSQIVQLWHADGIKRLSYTHKWRWKDFGTIFSNPGLFVHFRFLIASSPYIAKNFICPSFDVKEHEVRITGLPRYDAFFSSPKGATIDEHVDLGRDIARIKSHHPKKIILYAPTFRRGKTVVQQLEHLSLSALNDFLVAHNYFLIISLHPKFSASGWVPEHTLSNISYLNAEYDFYPYLKQFDLLVTDYSSTCIEFLLLGKPSIFYIHDIDEYRRREGLTEEFWNFMPGPRVANQAALCETLLATETLDREALDKRTTLFAFKEGEASRNVVNTIFDDMNNHRDA